MNPDLVPWAISAAIVLLLGVCVTGYRMTMIYAGEHSVVCRMEQK